MSKQNLSYKYQSVLMIVALDKAGNPIVKRHPVEVAADGVTILKAARNRTVYIDAPSVDAIPDPLYRQVATYIMGKLSSDGQFSYADAKQQLGRLFDSVRLDYLRRWVEGRAVADCERIQILSVRKTYWTSGKGGNRADTVDIAASYLCLNGRGVAGWVASGEGYEGAEALTRARIKWQSAVAKGIIASIHEKLVPGAGGVEALPGGSTVAHLGNSQPTNQPTKEVTTDG